MESSKPLPKGQISNFISDATTQELTKFLKLDGYVGSANDLKNLITAASTGASGISIVPTSPAPSGTGIASFTATQAGTYTNYGGLVVNANSFAVISRSASGVFSISQTALDLTGYVKKLSNSEICVNISEVIQLNSLLANSETAILTNDWDGAAINVFPNRKYNIINPPKPLVYVYYFSGIPSASTFLSRSGDGITPITTVSPPLGTRYLHINFLTNNSGTVKSSYINTFFEMEKIFSTEDVQEIINESESIFIESVAEEIVFNLVVNLNGSFTNSNDWDSVIIKINSIDRYVIDNLPAAYIIFYSAVPNGTSENVISYIGNGTNVISDFITPLGTKYIAIDFQITTSSLATYNNVYLRKFKENIITCWGDSITQGNFASDIDSFEYYLAPLIKDYRVVNCGVGGETSWQIAARQGGIPYYLKNALTVTGVGQEIIIGNSTDTGIYSLDGYDGNTQMSNAVSTTEERDTSKINPVMIDGIKFKFSTTGDRFGSDYISKLTVLSLPVGMVLNHNIHAKKMISTAGMRDYRSAHASIIFVGTNDIFDSTAGIVSRIKRMINYMGHTRVIVVTQWGELKKTFSQLVEMENAIEKEFGSSAFNLRKYAITQAYIDLGLTLSTSDQNRVNQGLIPVVLTIDGLHPTRAMYELMAKKFKIKLIENGIINES